MRYYFHADTTQFLRRRKATLITVIMPLLAVCIFCTVNIVLHLPKDGNWDFVKIMLIVIVSCVAVGIITAFAAAYFTDKLCRRHSKYTYFDILPNGMVYSLYAGEFINGGKREIYRRLYYIPFSGFERAIRDPKTDPCALTIKGEVHEYLLPSRLLGYHVGENGEISFDNWELNTRGFELRRELLIKDRLGSTKTLERSVCHYAKLFAEKPEKKPFDISEHIVQRTKKRSTTSNPALDAPSYDRRW